MPIPNQCSCYRKSKGSGTYREAGYCELIRNQTTCQGDIHSCKNLIGLRKYLLRKKENKDNHCQDVGRAINSHSLIEKVKCFIQGRY